MKPAVVLPEHHEQLVALFRDEAWCTRYLFLLRWPDDFICPCCGRNGGNRRPAARITCRDCGRTSSITAGTLLHGTKKPLSTWLRMVWSLCESQDCGTIKTMQRRLNIGSYQTAWNWMHTLRLAMNLANRQRCKGTVEIDCGFVAFRKDGKQGRYLVAAVEVEPKNRLTGRIRISQYPALSPALLSRFLDRAVEPGSLLLAPDQGVFRALVAPSRLYLVETGCPYQVHAREVLTRCCSAFDAQQGPKKTASRLQYHLDEFCFRANSTLLANRRSVFEQLLRSLLHRRPSSEPRTTAELCTAGGFS